MKRDTVIRVAITSIGSGVGQSVINSCRLSNLPLETHGLGTNPFAFGAYSCDQIAFLPSIYAENYIEELHKYCVTNAIDILIPGLDDELIELSIQKDRFLQDGILPVVTTTEIVTLCSDKECLGKNMKAMDRYFTGSFSVQSAIRAIRSKYLSLPVLAKPRSGYASRGIRIIDDVSELEKLDENTVIQEIVYPGRNDMNYHPFMESLAKKNVPQVSELSVQIVMGNKSNLLGVMTTSNKLNNGVPIEITPISDPELNESINHIIDGLMEMGHTGPVNVQGRMTDRGPKYFEMNARFTGISGARAMLGFNEVDSVIRDFLGFEQPEPSLTHNSRKIAIRQVADCVVNLDASVQLSEMVKRINRNGLNPTGKNILVTGANGILGSQLIKKLVQRDDVAEVFAIVRDPDSFRHRDAKVQVVSRDRLREGALRFGTIDMIYHLGFSRDLHDVAKLNDSIEYTSFLMKEAANNRVARVVNVSSTAVYGTSRPPFWDETLPPLATTSYGQAKYFSEILTNQVVERSPSSLAINIRLSALSGPGYSRSTPYRFAEAVSKGEPILLQGGRQKLDILDVRDAVHALVRLMENGNRKWSSVYNVGSGQSLSIIEFAECADRLARQRNLPGSEIQVLKSDTEFMTGMNIEKFMNDSGWQPIHTLMSTYLSLFDHLEAKDHLARLLVFDDEKIPQLVF